METLADLLFVCRLTLRISYLMILFDYHWEHRVPEQVINYLRAVSLFPEPGDWEGTCQVTCSQEN